MARPLLNAARSDEVWILSALSHLLINYHTVGDITDRQSRAEARGTVRQREAGRQCTRLGLQMYDAL